MRDLLAQWYAWRTQPRPVEEEALSVSPMGVGGAVSVKKLAELVARQRSRRPFTDVWEQLVRVLSRPGVADWAEREWQSVGGAGMARLTPAGRGMDAAVYRARPGDEVLKLYPFPQRLGMLERYQAPVPPEVLAPTRMGLSPGGELLYATQPFVVPYAKAQRRGWVSPEEVDRALMELQGLSKAAGRTWWDPYARNAGSYQGQPRILDLGSVDWFRY